MKTTQQKIMEMEEKEIRNWLRVREINLRLNNIFNGAGIVTLVNDENIRISTNGALEDLEDYLKERGIEFTTYLN